MSNAPVKFVTYADVVKSRKNFVKKILASNSNTKFSGFGPNKLIPGFKPLPNVMSPEITAALKNKIKNAVNTNTNNLKNNVRVVNATNVTKTNNKGPRTFGFENYTHKNSTAPRTNYYSLENTRFVANSLKAEHFWTKNKNLPQFLGKILYKDREIIVFANVQPPYASNNNTNVFSPVRGNKVNDEKAAMGKIHLLVIPTKFIFNVIDVLPRDKALIQTMHTKGISIAKRLAGAMGLNNANNDSAYLSGFHVYPKNSVPWLHMHIVHNGSKFGPSYKHNITGKMVKTKDVIDNL